MKTDEKRLINYKTVEASREEVDSMFSEDTMIDLEEVLKNKKSWQAMYQYLIYFMMYGVSDESLRYRTITIFKKSDSSFKPMRISVIKFTINMILLYSIMRTDSVDILNNNMIITEPYGFTKAYIKQWIDDYIIDCDGVSKNEKCYIIDVICFHVSSISKTFDDILGLGMSIRAFYDMEKQDERLANIFHDRIDPTLQPKDIETAISNHVKMICEIISNTNNEIACLIKSGKLISPGQFGEVSVAIGFKSDLDGNTIPIPSLNNIMITGINNAIDKYIDSVGGRKACINSKIGISVPGATSKKMNANAADFTLRRNNVMCDSVVTMPFTIKNDQYLEGMNGHYYYDDKHQLQCINYKHDKHLIGQTLNFRSPITCNCGDGEICRYCYPSKLTEANSSLASIGAYAAIVMGEPLGQMMLSTKHHNGTNSHMIEFGDDFQKDFELVLSDICIKSSDTDATYISIPDIFKSDLDDDCSEYMCDHFDVLDKNHNVLYEVREKNGAKLFIIDQLDTMLRTKKVRDRTSLEVDMMELDSDEPLFMVEVVSAQMNDAAKQVRKLIGTKDKCGCKTYTELLNALIEAYLSAGIFMNFAHFEVIIKSLLRKASDIYAFPDFGEHGDPADYQILSLNDVLYHSMSPMVCFRTANLKKQLIEAALYTNHKTKPSHLDVEFAERPAEVMPDEYCE